MLQFNTPEIKKRWQTVLDRPFQTFLRNDFIVKQGEPFEHHFLIVHGEVEAYRQVSSRKLGIKAHITSLGLYDVISIDSDIANYCIKVTSHLLRVIRLKQNQRYLVCGNAVKQWRDSKAQALQKQYNMQKSLEKRQKRDQHKYNLTKFVQNFTSLSSKQITQSNIPKLPMLSQSRKSRKSKSLSNLSSKKSSPTKNPERMFGLIVKDYFMKKIDYESKSIAITLRETTSSKMINGLNH